MTMAIDGAAASTTNHGTSDSTSASLTTTQTNDIIVAMAYAESSGTPSINSVSGGGLTWTRRNTNTTIANFSGATQICCELWWAAAPTALTAASITVSSNLAPAGNVGIIVFGVSGIPAANASNPFDPNVSLPAITSNQTSVNNNTNDAANCPALTTTNNNTMLLEFWCSDGGTGDRVDTPNGWTDVGVANNFTAGPGRCLMLAGYFVKSAPVSAFPATFRDFANGWQIIGDALTSDAIVPTASIPQVLKGKLTQAFTNKVLVSVDAAETTAENAAFSADDTYITADNYTVWRKIAQILSGALTQHLTVSEILSGTIGQVLSGTLTQNFRAVADAYATIASVLSGKLVTDFEGFESASLIAQTLQGKLTTNFQALETIFLTIGQTLPGRITTVIIDQENITLTIGSTLHGTLRQFLFTRQFAAAGGGTFSADWSSGP